MEIQHINVKLFIEETESVDLEKFGRVFNGWIQERATDTLLVDVADYRHVYAGPGIILIGHEANYSLDQTDNRLGLLYNRKAHVDGTTLDRLLQATQAALLAAQKLAAEQGLKFSGRELQVIVNDRVLAPNTFETFTALEPELRAFFNRLFGGLDYSLAHNADPRSRFSVNAVATSNIKLDTLTQNAAVESVEA